MLWGVCVAPLEDSEARNPQLHIIYYIIRKAANICLETTLGKGMGRKLFCMLAVCDKKMYLQAFCRHSRGGRTWQVSREPRMIMIRGG